MKLFGLLILSSNGYYWATPQICVWNPSGGHGCNVVCSNCYFLLTNLLQVRVVFFLPKSFFLYIAVHTRDEKLVSSSKFPIGLMISGKSTRMNSWWFCCGGKATGSPKAKGRLVRECPCPTAFPGVRTVTVKQN
jgi:hypothetical protein